MLLCNAVQRKTIIYYYQYGTLQPNSIQWVNVVEHILWLTERLFSVHCTS